MHRRTVLIAVVAALFGAATGAGSLLWYQAGPMQQNVLARMQFDAAYTISVLEELRAGKLKHAQDLLEGRVDGAVLGLSGFAREDAKRSAEALATLQAIAKYRAGVSYIPSDAAKGSRVPDILDAAREGHLTPQSRTDAR